jgi:hypothetical protein
VFTFDFPAFFPAFSPPLPACAARAAMFSVFMIPYFLIVRRRKDTTFFNTREDFFMTDPERKQSCYAKYGRTP